jgi:hypothetical protein
MSQVGFEHTIPLFEGAKTVHASERSATVTKVNQNPSNPKYYKK